MSLNDLRRLFRPDGASHPWQSTTFRYQVQKVCLLQYTLSQQVSDKLADATVIPGVVKSQVSLRIVPDQDLDTIIKALCDHLETSFQRLKSPNKLEVR